MWKTVLRFFVQIEQSAYFIQQKKVFQFRKLLRICILYRMGKIVRQVKSLQHALNLHTYICTIWQIFKLKVQIPYTKNEIRVEKLNAHTYQSSPFCLILQNIIYIINGAGGWNTWRKEFVITVIIRVQFFYISCSYTKKVKNL